MAVCIFLFTGIGDTAGKEYIEELLKYYNQVVSTPQYQEVQVLFNDNKYEDAFKLLAENAIKNPELEVPFVASMIILRQQIDNKPQVTGENTDKDDFLNTYFTIANSVLEELSPKSRNFLLSDMAEICLIQNKPKEAYSYMDTLIKGIGTTQSDEYALAMYQYANTAIAAGENLKAMQMLEDLRRNMNYYSEGIQDKVNFQLFNIYSMLKKDDFVIKLGEELRHKFEEKEIKDFSDVSDLVNILKRLADVYLDREIYNLANDLYDKIIELLEKYKAPEGDIRKKFFSQLYNDAKDRKKLAMKGMGDNTDTYVMTGKEFLQEAGKINPTFGEFAKKQLNIPDSKENKPMSPTNTSPFPVISNIINIHKSSFFIGVVIGIAIMLITLGGAIMILKLKNK